MSTEPEEHAPFWLIIARRKCGAGPEWAWCRIEAVDKSLRPTRHDMIVEGGLPTVRYEKGPRKGKPNWRKIERQTAVVTQEEMATEATAYESSTGRCSRCFGAGKVVSGFGAGGTTYRGCSKCNETGLRASPSSTRSPSDG